MKKWKFSEIEGHLACPRQHSYEKGSWNLNPGLSALVLSVGDEAVRALCWLLPDSIVISLVLRTGRRRQGAAFSTEDVAGWVRFLGSLQEMITN